MLYQSAYFSWYYINQSAYFSLHYVSLSISVDTMSICVLVWKAWSMIHFITHAFNMCHVILGCNTISGIECLWYGRNKLFNLWCGHRIRNDTCDYLCYSTTVSYDSQAINILKVPFSFLKITLLCSSKYSISICSLWICGSCVRYLTEHWRRQRSLCLRQRPLLRNQSQSSTRWPPRRKLSLQR